MPASEATVHDPSWTRLVPSQTLGVAGYAILLSAYLALASYYPLPVGVVTLAAIPIPFFALWT